MKKRTESALITECLKYLQLLQNTGGDGRSTADGLLWDRTQKMKCDRCISIGEFGSCQNFKSPHYGQFVCRQEACEFLEEEVDDNEPN